MRRASGASVAAVRYGTGQGNIEDAHIEDQTYVDRIHG